MLAACGSKKPAIRVYRHATYLGVWDRRYDSLVPGFNRIPPPDAISTFKVKYRNPEGILDITQEDLHPAAWGVWGLPKPLCLCWVRHVVGPLPVLPSKKEVYVQRFFLPI